MEWIVEGEPFEAREDDGMIADDHGGRWIVESFVGDLCRHCNQKMQRQFLSPILEQEDSRSMQHSTLLLQFEEGYGACASTPTLSHGAASESGVNFSIARVRTTSE